jgi:hypothetical protein
MMETQLQSLLDRLVKSQFTDLKGSWANLRLELSETVVNELLANVLATQKKQYPLLGLVSTARVKGTVVLEVKLEV